MRAPTLRHALAVTGLLLAMVLGAVAVVAVLVVRGVLLDAGTYRDALVDADAYERVYTDVLSDPELAPLANQLAGGLALEVLTPDQVRVLTTNALRWAVPPAALQQGTETVIDATLAYIRGDVDRIDTDIDVSAVLDRVDDTSVRAMSTALADVAERAVASLPEYRDRVDALLDDVAAGVVPADVPILGGTTFDADEVVTAILTVLGPRADEDLRRRITAAVHSGEERDALIEAAAAAATEHGDRIAASLRASAERGGVLDVVGEVAERARRPVGEVVGALDGVRRTARWAHPGVGMAAALVVAAAAVALVWIRRDDLTTAAYLVAAGLALSGLAVVVVAWAVAAFAEEPLGRATGQGPGTWDLPGGLRQLLADVEGSIADALVRPPAAIAVLLVVSGALVAAGAALAPAARALVADTGARVPAFAVGGVAIGLWLVALLVVVPASELQAAEQDRCNGHVELCDRRYDEVVYAATHNAMSSPGVVDVWPEHDGDIAAQLDAGVRALLIDTHYWTAAVSPEVLQAAEPLLPPALARLLHGSLGERLQAREGTWLCHAHCAFGGIPFLDAMVTVRRFLEANPGEVVTLIIQDAISREDTEQVMRDAGLLPYLHVHDPDEPWATLGELVERGERVVVLAEEEGPPPAWYHHGFTLMQETPYRFLAVEELSCAPNRGEPDATLFQLNHWIQRIAPDRADSAAINRHDVLVERARQCQRERGLLPNFLAVNHYNIGDLMAAVDTLNGVG